MATFKILTGNAHPENRWRTRAQCYWPTVEPRTEPVEGEVPASINRMRAKATDGDKPDGVSDAPDCNPPDCNAPDSEAMVRAEGVATAPYQSTSTLRAAAPELRRAGGRAVAVIVDEAISSLQNFIILFAALHYLSLIAIGEVTLAYLTVLLVKIVLRSLLLEPLTIRFSGAEPDERRTAGAQAVGAAVVVGVACLVLAGVTALAFDGQWRAILLACAVAAPALIVQEAWRVYFFASARPLHAVLNDSICFAGTIGLVVVYIRAGNEITAASLLALWAAGKAIGALAGAVQSGFLPAVGGALTWMRTHWDLGSRLAGADSVEQVAGRVGVALVGVIAGGVALGRISASLTLVTPVTTLVASVAIFAAPEAARLRRRGDRRLSMLILSVSVALAVLVISFGVVVQFLPDGAGRLLAGENWELAKSLLLPVVLWYAASAAQMGPRIGLRIFERGRLTLQLSIVTAVAILVAVVIGSAINGATGGAWGFAVSYLLMTIVWWVAYQSVARTESFGRR